MSGLLLKDLYNMKSVLLLYLLFPIAMSVFCLMNENLSMIIFIPSFMGLFMTISSFAYDELSRFPEYALSLPLLKKDIVYSKYCLSLITLVIFFIFSLIIAGVLLLLMPARFSNNTFYEFMIGSFASVAVIIVLISFMIPFMFKYGTEKARLIIVAAFLCIGLGGGFFFEFLDITIPDMSFLVQFMDVFPWVILGIVILGVVISLRTSMHIMMHKEF